MIRRVFFRRQIGRLERLLIFAVTAASLACHQSDDHPPAHPVRGEVLDKEKPITGGVVVYEREGGEATALEATSTAGPLRGTGRIEADGSFRLVAFPGTEGMPTGHYKIGISSAPRGARAICSTRPDRPGEATPMSTAAGTPIQVSRD